MLHHTGVYTHTWEKAMEMTRYSFSSGNSVSRHTTTCYVVKIQLWISKSKNLFKGQTATVTEFLVNQNLNSTRKTSSTMTIYYKNLMYLE